MPPRSQRPALRVILPVLCCALTAPLPAPTAHAQTPAPAKTPAAPAAPSTPATPAAKAPAAAAPPAPGKAPVASAKAPSAPAIAKAPAKPIAKPAIVALTPADEVRRTFKDKITPFIGTYCVECHCDRRMKGGVNFAPALKNPSDPAHSRRWKLGLATVNAHDMPPEDADKQPTDAEREEFMAWVGRLKYLSPQDPGAFVIRRLTKTEYGNTLHDLLGVSPDIVKELPDEVPGEGYLNTLSPLQMEQYLGIANAALEQAFSRGSSFPLLHLFLGPAPPPGTDLKAAARSVARTLARATYRRPASDAEIDVLLQVYDLATQNKLPHADALRLMLKATLVSPQFLYITPATINLSSTASTTGQGTTNPSATPSPAPHSIAPNSPAKNSAPTSPTAPSSPAPPPAPEILPLDDWMLASRLSYLLWATMPDGELSTLADQGKLHDPAVLRTQVARMLKDDRSRALFDGFGAQWLGLADLADKTFDTTKFPQMTPALRQAMYDEARLFFTSIIRENAPVSTFITADYTYLNESLAALYAQGANTKSATTPVSLTGSNLRRVKLPDPNRGGILGMPGILAVTSFPNRTSPVKRGVWVLEQILGQHVPPAPPNVPTLEKQDKKKIANLTLRQRTELHRTNVVCANCHKILDPIGFGLENFDAIGRWRSEDDTGGPIDAAGELPGGKRFSTPAELKSIIAARKDDLTRNLTEKLLAYALCRQLEGYDEIIIDQLMTGIAKDNHRMQTLITSVITSYPFLNRRIVETLSAPAVATKPAAAPKPKPTPAPDPVAKPKPAAATSATPAAAAAKPAPPPTAAPAKK